MNPLQHSDAGSGRETAIFVAVAVAVAEACLAKSRHVAA